VAQVGIEPTASRVLSSSGRPFAYRAVSFTGARSGLRTDTRAGLSRAALPVGAPGQANEFRGLESNQRFLGQSQALLPLNYPGIKILACCHPRFGEKDSNPHGRFQRPPAYRLADPRISLSAFTNPFTVSSTSRRKGRESNPQGRKATPFSRRAPSPVGLPFRL
jgi:hypothetical protein